MRIGRWRKQSTIGILAIVYSCLALSANAQTLGGACSTAGSLSMIGASSPGELLVCSGSTWVLAEAITSAGNVGIGNPTPNAPLAFPNTVANKIFLYDGGPSVRHGIGIQDNETQFYVPATGHFSFDGGGDLQTSGTNEVMRVLATGNVGIGTAAPNTTLDVNGVIAADGSNTITSNPPTIGTNLGWKVGLFSNLYAVGVAAATMAFKVDSSGAWVSVFGTNPANNANGTTPDTNAKVSFGTNGSGLFTGNVGIGTTAPASKLDVEATSASTVEIARFLNNGSSDGGYIFLPRPEAPTLHGLLIGHQATPPSQRMNAIDVQGGISQSLLIQVGQDDSSNYGVLEINPSGGNVGIGTTNAGSTLTVNGAATATSFSPSSDGRLKKDIQTLQDALERVEKLRGVSFDWRTRDERVIGHDLNLPVDEHQIGLIAQEVERVYPEAVGRDSDGIKNVNYNALVAPLVEAVKEQQAEIRQMQLDAKQRRQEIDRLTLQLSNLTANGSFQTPLPFDRSEFPSGRNGQH